MGLVGCPPKNRLRLLLKDTLKKIFQTLSHRESVVLTSRYLKGMTHREIAKEFNVCPARVGQIEHRAIMKLRGPLRAYILEEWI